MSDLIIAFGSGDTFLYNAPNQWARHNLPEDFEELFTRKSRIRDIKAVAFGNSKDSFVVTYVEDDGKNQKTDTLWDDVPAKLDAFLESWVPDKKDKVMKVSLGPDESFFAMTSTSLRWDKLPGGLEEVLQEWFSPKGWTAGPPAWVTLGFNESYIIVSEQGASGWDLADSYPTLLKHLTDWGLDEAPWKLWSTLECVYLHPYREDEFIVVDKTQKAWSKLSTPMSEDFDVVITSLTDPDAAKTKAKELERGRKEQQRVAKEAAAEREKMRREEERLAEEARANGPPPKRKYNHTESTAQGKKNKRARKAEARQREEEEKKNERQRQEEERQSNKRRQEEERRNRKQKQEESREYTRSRDASSYAAWKFLCHDLTTAIRRKQLRHFPAPPLAACVCNEAGCKAWKTEADNLGICKHDLATLLRHDAEYSYVWLKKERLLWHPDKFAGVASDLKAEFERKGKHMFATFGELLADMEAS